MGGKNQRFEVSSPILVITKRPRPTTPTKPRSSWPLQSNFSPKKRRHTAVRSTLASFFSNRLAKQCNRAGWSVKRNRHPQQAYLSCHNCDQNRSPGGRIQRTNPGLYSKTMKAQSERIEEKKITWIKGAVKKLHLHNKHPRTTTLAGRTHPPEHRNARALGSSAGMMGSNTW